DIGLAGALDPVERFAQLRDAIGTRVDRIGGEGIEQLPPHDLLAPAHRRRQIGITGRHDLPGSRGKHEVGARRRLEQAAESFGRRLRVSSLVALALEPPRLLALELDQPADIVSGDDARRTALVVDRMRADVDVDELARLEPMPPDTGM